MTRSNGAAVAIACDRRAFCGTAGDCEERDCASRAVQTLFRSSKAVASGPTQVMPSVQRAGARLMSDCKIGG